MNGATLRESKAVVVPVRLEGRDLGAGLEAWRRDGPGA